MNFVFFYHSVLSDWNHGNAHFLRGVATELAARGHQVQIMEPGNSWSAQNLMAEHGGEPFRKFHEKYPLLEATRYDPESLELDKVLNGADIVLVHEWTDPGLVGRIGDHHRLSGGYRLFFHDTHHRMISDPAAMAAFDLDQYDGVLAYGRILQELYVRSGRVARSWTWHEAADTRVFHPWPEGRGDGDLVWIGNWGDGERTAELDEFLIQPCRRLGLKSRVYGVRYPEAAISALQQAAIEYSGWVPNFEVPQVFARFHVTIHVPRRPYVERLRGIPTIRPFEALACGIPLVCSPWEDAENLFTPGKDYLVARNGPEMERHLESVLHDADLRRSLIRHGLNTIQTRHTCAHRVDELLGIAAELEDGKPPAVEQEVSVL